MEDKTLLITGGCGFIGSNIAEKLLKNKLVKKIIIMDNLITGYRKNITFLLEKYNNIEFIYGDIGKLEDCRKAMKDCDLVCHQAALGSVPRSINDPLSSHLSNVNGFLNILLTAKENNIKRIVYASSSSVYGDDNNLPKKENSVGKVLSPYAATKKIDEIYANVFSKCYQMEIIGLRYFNIFGKRQDPKGSYAAVIPKFIDLMLQNKSPVINGDGNFSRDFTYIDNAVDANLLALTTNNQLSYGEVFNVGAGGQTSILDLFNCINKILKKNINPVFGPHRLGDVPHSNADINKTKEILNYQPKISFEVGIEKTIEYYKNL